MYEDRNNYGDNDEDGDRNDREGGDKRNVDGYGGDDGDEYDFTTGHSSESLSVWYPSKNFAPGHASESLSLGHLGAGT